MRSIRWQLSAVVTLVVLFAITVAGFSANVIIENEFEKYMARQQKIKADEIASNFDIYYDRATKQWDTGYVHGLCRYALTDGYIIKVYNPNGDIVWDAENHNMVMCAHIVQEIISRMEERRPNVNGEFLHNDYELIVDGENVGTLSVGYYSPYFLSEGDFRFLDTLNLVFIIIGTVSLILSLIVSGFFARRIASPIAKTAYIAKQITDGNYYMRFEGKTKSKELDELVAAINHLANGLAEQEKLRKRLAVDVAHELRTPLTTLGSHLEVMIEGIWKPTTERLQSCHEEIERLSGLVTDLERLAEIEGDGLILNRTHIDLMDIAKSACEQFEIEIKKKNLSLILEGDSSFLYADKDRLSQVMTNLLSNAIKYTLESGKIHITVKSTDKEGIIIVEDDGIGIPEHQLLLVFERFYRTDKSRNRKTGGAGIGLAIVKSIVIAHGGTVNAESKQECGSRFTVILPK